MPEIVNFEQFKTILVIGFSDAAQAMYDRIILSAPNNVDVKLSQTPIEGDFDLVLDVDQTSLDELRKFHYQMIYQPTWSFCFGRSKNIQKLEQTDWIGLKILESIIINLHRDGLIRLTRRQRNSLKQRAMLRKESDLDDGHFI